MFSNMNELVATEETYVELLTKLLANYVLSLPAKNIISSDDIKVLFPDPDISQIRKYNLNFFAALKKRMEKFDNNTTKIGDIILQFVPFFKIYQQFDEALFLDDTKKKKSLFKFFFGVEKKKKGSIVHGYGVVYSLWILWIRFKNKTMTCV
ncbi:hypothetical protein RFI_21378 [Reticulomyxa filosa]|uniref:DH domain-containing protein n=1 Tax=Reticulomyxa filosa TaxID=46433 RepID=X6MRC4_RETFI|nr:hypothetical protein RFI_21378 [Reticulomyxa filosa]|eukprot:ETO15982.1 hypothetical protein RFI_21378 [Reticulomyxa filosa]